jgi:hypothetical protein
MLIVMEVQELWVQMVWLTQTLFFPQDIGNSNSYLAQPLGAILTKFG